MNVPRLRGFVTQLFRQRLNVVRGLIGAMIGTAIGAALTAAIPTGFLICRWYVVGASDSDRAYDLRDARELLVFPIIGCTAVCACAGWATFAPFGRYHFARSLLVIFLVSVPFWYLIKWMELTPLRQKGVNHPVLYPTEALALIGPPIAVAALLTFMRVRSTLSGCHEPIIPSKVGGR
jgi:hypothetical protein